MTEPIEIERVRRAVELLGEQPGDDRRLCPTASPSRMSCVVDRDLRLHALRLWAEPTAIPSVPPSIAYACVDANAPRPARWRALPSDVEIAAFPVLFPHDGRIMAGIGGMKRTVAGWHRRILSQQYDVFVFCPADARAGSMTEIGLRVGGHPVRYSAGPGGSLYALAPQWFSPDTAHDDQPLVLAVFRGAPFAAKTVIVGGTGHPESQPDDYALHVARDGRVHVVYIGVRAGQDGAAPRMWHLTLDERGGVERVRDVAKAPPFPMLTEVLVAPDGRLWLLAVWGKDGTQRHTAADLYPLAGRDAPGGPVVRYFVDYWLGVHAVSFASPTPEYLGPGEAPAP